MLPWYVNFIKKEYFRLFPLPEELEQPSVWGTITNQEVYTVMPRQYTDTEGKKHNNSVKCYDKIYRTTTQEELQRFLDVWKYRKPDDPPEAPKMSPDCDDRALRLLGDIKAWTNVLCVGTLWTLRPGHMKLVFIDINVVPWEIEPSSGKMLVLDRDDIYESRI